MEAGSHSSDCARRGLRILHRTAVQGVKDLEPGFGLPRHVRIDGPDAIGEGACQGGEGVSFR